MRPAWRRRRRCPRLADALRRRRFGAAPLAPTTLGVAVGLVAHVLSVEYHEGRGKMTERGFEQARERRERRRREAANGWGEDPESAAGSRYGDGDDDETLANGNGTRDGNGTFVSAFDLRARRLASGRSRHALGDDGVRGGGGRRCRGGDGGRGGRRFDFLPARFAPRRGARSPRWPSRSRRGATRSTRRKARRAPRRRHRWDWC